jgi:hypothetical protein
MDPVKICKRLVMVIFLILQQFKVVSIAVRIMFYLKY